MKNKLWEFSGKSFYWLTWPLLALYIYRTSRTRVLVICGDEVLVVKGWHGTGSWELPGGGLHRKELPADGAIRELYEETGISVTATDLQFLFSSPAKRHHGLSYKIFAYVLELKTKPELTKQKLEITHLEWMHWQKLYDDPKTNKNLKDIISVWFKKV